MTVMLLLKATLLWSTLLVAARLLRSAHPADRHRLWTIGFAAVLALPILGPMLPAVEMPIASTWALSAQPLAHAAPMMEPIAAAAIPPRSNALTMPTRRNVTDSGMTAGGARAFEWPSIRSIAISAWLFGALAAAVMLLVSLARVERLSLTARELNEPAWQDAMRVTAARLGVPRRIRLVTHDRVRVPMAGGLWRPVIYLPRAATDWSAERRDVVLAHEIAHLAGRDPLRLIAARLAVALYWFHPLAWIAARQSGVDREQACDAAVLAIGARPSAYAAVLLEFAESIQSRPPLTALPIVHRSLMERRVMAILREDRAAARTRLFLPAMFSVLATVVTAAAQPAAPMRASDHATIARVSAPAPHGSVISAVRTTPIPAMSRHAVGAPHVAAVSRAADLDCWSDASAGGSFNGSISTNGFDITEEIGTRDGSRVIEETIDNTRVCMIAAGLGTSTQNERPSDWITHADRLVMESQRNGRVMRLTLDGRSGSGQQISWTVNGAPRTFDAAAQQWRDRLLGVLDNIWQLATLRGEASTLRGRISTIYGQESTLRGRISTLEGEISTMRGEESTVRGQESSLRGEISSIRGHVSSLRGEISSEQGAISSLESRGGSDRSAMDAELARHNTEIARIERELRDYDEAGKIAAVEQRMKDLDVDRKIADIESRIHTFDLDGKTSAIEQQIKNLDVDGKAAAIQRQIQSLEVDRRGRQLEDQRDAALRQLEAVLERIK